MLNINRLKNPEKVNELFKTWELLSSTFDYDEILKRILSQATLITNGVAASIFLWDKNSQELYLEVATNLSDEECKKIRVPIGEGIVGSVASSGIPLIVNDVVSEKKFYKKIDTITGFRTESCLTVPLKIEAKLVGALQVINKADYTFFDDDDKDVIVHFAQIASIVIERAETHRLIVQKEIIEYDLQLAHKLQLKLIPSEPLISGNYQLNGFYKPARYIGGDYYDYYRISDDEIFFAIGDITGKGAEASLMMSGVKAFLFANIEALKSLEKVSEDLNNYFFSNSESDKFLTMFLAVLNTKTNFLRYVNAGHEPPFLFNKEREIKSLESNNLLLGAFPFWNCTVGEIHLEEGSNLFLYTDGITEAMNNQEEMFGTDKMKKLLLNSVDQPQTIIEKMPEKISEFSDGADQSDDITFLLLSAHKNVSTFKKMLKNAKNK